MIITIDGPAGAGKSSAAKALAKRLGFEFLDTGAMYRAVTLAGLRLGVDFDNPEAIAQLLCGLELAMPPGGRVVLNGEDVSGLIRTAEVSALASRVSAIPLVRSFLVERQRDIAAGRDMVCEGRDQGTVAFPDAACKFFLVADPAERARRRHKEMAQRGETTSLEDILRAQEVRDRRDASRAVATMVPAADAVLLDSTDLTPEQVVERMAAEVRRKGLGTGEGRA
jgi:cytidylate kinase